MKRQDLRDIALFGKVLSTGLVVGGYAFLGVWLSRWLETNNYPTWLSFAALPVVAAFGLWQGWLFLTKGTKPRNKSRDNNKK